MKKFLWMPVLYALTGAAVLLFLGIVNLKSTGTTITPTVLIIPSLVGLLSGFLLGSSRKKWQEKSRQLDEAAKELAQNLEDVKDQKVVTENLLRIMEKIPLPVYLKDKNHCYLLANEQYAVLAGKSWQQIKGQTDYEIFPEPIADLFREQDQEVMARQSGKTFEETVPLPAGIVTFETFKFPLFDDKSNIYAVGGICTDITSLKQAEDSLKSQQGRIDQVLGHMSEAAVATDCDTRVVMFNRRAAELTEQDADLAMGGLLEEVYNAQDPITGSDIKFWSELNGQRLPKDQENQEVILRTRTGRAQPVMQKTIVLLDRFGQNMGLLLLFQSSVKKDGAGKGNLEAQPRAGQQTQEESSPAKLNQPINIMVMDDDQLVRKTCALMLATEGYQTVFAQDGDEAVALYRRMLNTADPIKAVIMDLTVPGAMGGLEATNKILEMDPDARIMVASGYSNDPVLANFEEYGFLTRVEKPFAVHELIRAIEEILSIPKTP